MLVASQVPHFLSRVKLLELGSTKKMGKEKFYGEGKKRAVVIYNSFLSSNCFVVVTASVAWSKVGSL